MITSPSKRDHQPVTYRNLWRYLLLIICCAGMAGAQAQILISLSPVGNSPNANAATITGSILNMEPASPSYPGVMTAGTQSFGGAKTFIGQVTSGGGFLHNSNTLFRVEGNGGSIPSGATGAGLEFFVAGGTSYLSAANRPTGGYSPMALYGSTISFAGGPATFNHDVNMNYAVKIPTGAGAGKVLTSDATGVGTWQTPAVSAIPPINTGNVSGFPFNGRIREYPNMNAAVAGGLREGDFYYNPYNDGNYQLNYVHITPQTAAPAGFQSLTIRNEAAELANEYILLTRIRADSIILYNGGIERNQQATVMVSNSLSTIARNYIVRISYSLYTNITNEDPNNIPVNYTIRHIRAGTVIGTYPFTHTNSLPNQEIQFTLTPITIQPNDRFVLSKTGTPPSPGEVAMGSVLLQDQTTGNGLSTQQNATVKIQNTGTGTVYDIYATGGFGIVSVPYGNYVVSSFSGQCGDFGTTSVTPPVGGTFTINQTNPTKTITVSCGGTGG